MKYTVIAITCGDGTTDYGYHIWSCKFNSRKAAEEARKFVELWANSTILVEDI